MAAANVDYLFDMITGTKSKNNTRAAKVPYGDKYLFLSDDKSKVEKLFSQGILAAVVSNNSLCDIEHFTKRCATIYGIDCKGMLHDKKATWTSHMNDYIMVPIGSKTYNTQIINICEDNHKNVCKDGWIITYKKEQLWNDGKESDLVQAFADYIANKEGVQDTKSVALTCVADIEETEKEWLVQGYIPKGDVTCIVGEGGSGKTSAWCSLAAAVSRGDNAFLIDENFPQDFDGVEEGKVIYFSAEDSTATTLKRRLRKANAKLENILTVQISDEKFQEIKFNSDLLASLISEHKPKLCIFDPFQNFVPSEINLGARNAVRQAVNPLLKLGEQYGTTFIIVVHTNKQSGLWGRKRMADSSDLWDISRSVLMIGETGEKNIRYISQEKSNYGMLQQTVLFTINDEVVCKQGYCDKHDRDYVMAAAHEQKGSAVRDDCKVELLNYLEQCEGRTEVSDLEGFLRASGNSANAIKNAKSELKKDKLIRIYSKGAQKDKKWYVEMLKKK